MSSFEEQYKKALKKAENIINEQKQKKLKSTEDEERPTEYEDNASAILWCELTTKIRGTVRMKMDMYGHIVK